MRMPFVPCDGNLRVHTLGGLIKLRALLLLLPLTAAVQAQQPAPPALRSPEVSADRRVTFRVRAPQASKVTVLCECLATEPARTKDSEGVWRVTGGPLEPDVNETD